MADLLQRREQEELHDEPTNRRRAAPRERASKAWREDARAAGRHHRASRATGSGLGTWRASDHPGHGGTGRGARSPASRADALALRSRLAPRLAPAQAIDMGGPEMGPPNPPAFGAPRGTRGAPLNRYGVAVAARIGARHEGAGRGVAHEPLPASDDPRPIAK